MTKHYHFIGIGGISMGALASLLLDKGYKISGSDLRSNKMTDQLKEKGAVIYQGHEGRHVEGASVVVYSSAVKEDNVERIAAELYKIPLLRRAELLAQLMNEHYGITIAGAHGKTTTSSMIARLLIDAKLAPTVAVGGMMNGLEANAYLGDGQYFVSEVDESDGTFLKFFPHVSVVTNFDFEHVDYYLKEENLKNCYEQYLAQTRPEGLLIICGDDLRLKKMTASLKQRVITYGFDQSNQCYVRKIKSQRLHSEYEVVLNKESLGIFKLSVPGEHNVLNSLAAIIVGKHLNIDMETVKKSLWQFSGVQRRFQIKGIVNDVTVIDDYGHHPTEIKTTLNAVKKLNPQRIIAVIQPHRYSRLHAFMSGFAESAKIADMIIVTNVYSAGEAPIEGATGPRLAELIAEKDHRKVIYLKKDEIAPFVKQEARSGDVVITLGAGDITRVSEYLVELLQIKTGYQSPILS